MLGNDMMTSDNIPNPVFSILTMAFLQDIGWYEIDYSLAETFTFGKDKGCDFLFQSCIKSDGVPRFPDFCNPNTQAIYGCTADFMAIGFCDEGDGTKIESSSWNYYNGATSSDTFNDNCAYYMTSA